MGAVRCPWGRFLGWPLLVARGAVRRVARWRVVRGRSEVLFQGFSLRWRVGFSEVGGLMLVWKVFRNPPYTGHLFVGGVWFVRFRH